MAQGLSTTMSSVSAAVAMPDGQEEQLPRRNDDAGPALQVDTQQSGHSGPSAPTSRMEPAEAAFKLDVKLLYDPALAVFPEDREPETLPQLSPRQREAVVRVASELTRVQAVTQQIRSRRASSSATIGAAAVGANSSQGAVGSAVVVDTPSTTASKARREAPVQYAAVVEAADQLVPDLLRSDKLRYTQPYDTPGTPAGSVLVVEDEATWAVAYAAWVATGASREMQALRQVWTAVRALLVPPDDATLSPEQRATNLARGARGAWELAARPATHSFFDAPSMRALLRGASTPFVSYDHWELDAMQEITGGRQGAPPHNHSGGGSGNAAVAAPRKLQWRTRVSSVGTIANLMTCSVNLRKGVSATEVLRALREAAMAAACANKELHAMQVAAYTEYDEAMTQHHVAHRKRKRLGGRGGGHAATLLSPSAYDGGEAAVMTVELDASNVANVGAVVAQNHLLARVKHLDAAAQAPQAVAECVGSAMAWMASNPYAVAAEAGAGSGEGLLAPWSLETLLWLLRWQGSPVVRSLALCALTHCMQHSLEAVLHNVNLVGTVMPCSATVTVAIWVARSRRSTVERSRRRLAGLECGLPAGAPAGAKPSVRVVNCQPRRGLPAAQSASPRRQPRRGAVAAGALGAGHIAGELGAPSAS